MADESAADAAGGAIERSRPTFKMRLYLDENSLKSLNITYDMCCCISSLLFFQHSSDLLRTSVIRFDICAPFHSSQMMHSNRKFLMFTF